MQDGIRLNKFISDSGYCSRREADKLIEENRVLFNGKKPELGARYKPGDQVCVDGRKIKGRANQNSQADREYIAYNKPINITSTTERNVRGNIIDAIGYKKRIFPIGRLDKMSEGLIFLTSDGDIVNKILRAENAHDKEYLVTVDKPINNQFLTKMSQGVPILGTVTKPCKINMVSQYVFKIILTEGLNRQIRRMAEYFGYEVTKLKRVRIMNVSLGSLKPGEWRKLTAKEMEDINTAVADSTGLAQEGVQSRTKKSATNSRSGQKRKPSNNGQSKKSPTMNKKSAKPVPEGRRGPAKPKHTIKGQMAKKPSRKPTNKRK